MKRLYIPWAAVALLFSLFVVPASSAPLGALQAGSAFAEHGVVEKTHGWHHRCRWGPRRYHRHVRGYGNVRCRSYRNYYYGGYYVRPYRYGRSWNRPYYRRHHGFRGGPRVHRNFSGRRAIVGGGRAFRGGGSSGYGGFRAGGRVGGHGGRRR